MFKLNFYEIDTLINEPVSIWISLFVTFLGTGLGFMGALYLSKRVERIQKKRDATQTIKLYWSRLKYFFQLVDNSIEILLKNIERYESLITEITKAPTDLHMLSIFADNNLQRLQRMDTNEIFDAYHILIPENEESIKDYKNIYGNIDFIHLNMDQMIDSYKIYKDNISRDQHFIKDKIQTLATVMIKWIKDIETKPDFSTQPNYLFLVKYFKVYKQMTTDVVDFSNYETQFLLPFGDELRTMFDQEDFFYEFFQLLNQPILKYKDIRLNSKVFTDGLSDTIKGVKVSSGKLKEISKKITSHNIS